MHHLITPTGELIDANANSLRRRFGAVVANESLVGFLIRNMGYTGFARDGDSVALRIKPSRFTLAAYARLARLVEDASPRRVSLAWHEGGWTYEVLPGVEPALMRISKLLAIARNDGRPQKYITEPRALDNLDRNHPFAELLEVWRETSGQLNVDGYPDLLQGPLLGRYAVMSVDRSTGGVHFQRLGGGYGMYYSGWAERFIGQRVDDQPDIEYGRAVANCNRAAIACRSPQLTDVDAIIFDPKSKRRIRGQYERLSLPIKASNGDVRLLCSTLMNASINMRLQIQEEFEQIVD